MSGPARTLLEELQARGAVVTATAPDRLRVEAPAGLLTDEDRARLRQYKAELLALLARGDDHEANAPTPCRLAAPIRALTEGETRAALIAGLQEQRYPDALLREWRWITGPGGRRYASLSDEGKGAVEAAYREHRRHLEAGTVGVLDTPDQDEGRGQKARPHNGD